MTVIREALLRGTWAARGLSSRVAAAAILQNGFSSWTQVKESSVSGSNTWRYLAMGTGVAAVAAGCFLQPSMADAQAGKVYTQEEVAKHKDKESRIWVTYKDGVYDITDFISSHPGGTEKIMMAAGGAVDPFWAMYQQHTKPEVADILQEYRIGTLSGGGGGGSTSGRRGWFSWGSAKSAVDGKAGSPKIMANPWGNEPKRNPALISRSENPCNAETPGHILAANLVTPTDLFYVRNHLPVPELDATTWQLVIEGEGLRRVVLDLNELQSQFKKHTVAATVQCSGNRRNEMKSVKPVKGLDWNIGAIGTAVWSGVKLVDVLRAAGIEEEDPTGLHVHFIGADVDPVSGEVYGASIPIEMAGVPQRDVLLAYEMNGAPLSRDHGYPVRVVVPGVAGARSVKWLTKVVVSKEESQSHWQQKDYKSFSPTTDWDTVDWSSAPAIHDTPVTSAITEPTPGTVVRKGAKDVTVRGYAFSGGGRDVVRVDVTADGGKTWTTAELKKLPQHTGRAWAWTLWEAEVPIPAQHQGPLEIAAKATDDSYNSQPDTVAGIWNLRGVVNNAWHRIKVNL